MASDVLSLHEAAFRPKFNQERPPPPPLILLVLDGLFIVDCVRDVTARLVVELTAVEPVPSKDTAFFFVEVNRKKKGNTKGSFDLLSTIEKFQSLYKIYYIKDI